MTTAIKIIAGVLVAILVALSAFVPAYGEEARTWYVNLRPEKYLNVRAESTKESKAVTTLNGGESFTQGLVSLSNKGWFYVDGKGWVDYTFLSIDPPHDPKPATLVGSGGVNLRSRPGTDKTLIDVYRPGTNVKVLARLPDGNDVWCKVRIGKREGWVMEQFVAYDEVQYVCKECGHVMEKEVIKGSLLADRGE